METPRPRNTKSTRISEPRGTARLRTAWCALASRPLLSTFAIAIVLRGLVISVLAAAGITDTFSFDATTYDGMARAVVEGHAKAWDEGTSGLYASTFTFMAPVSLIYFATDANQALGQLYVALLGAGVAVLVAALALKIMEPKWALAAGVAIAVLPSQVLWSSLLLKDASVWLFLAALAVVVATAGKKTGWKMVAWWALAAGLLLGLGYLRGHTTVAAAWALGLAAFMGMRQQRLVRGLTGLSVAIAIPWLIGLGPGGVVFAQNAGSLEYRRAANALGANSAFVEALGSEETSPEAVALQKEITTLQATGEELAQRLRTRKRLEQQASRRAERLAELAKKTAKRRQEVQGALLAAGEGVEGGAVDPSAIQRLRAKQEQIRRQEKRIQREERRIRLEASRLTAAKQQLKKEQAAIAAAQQQAQAQQQQTATQQPALEDSGGLDPNIAHLPRGLTVMLFEPVPWRTGGSALLQMARGEALLWYPLLFFASVGLWVARKHLFVLAFPLLIGGGMLILYALAEGNIGTAFRHRGEFVWVVALLGALGAREILERRPLKKGMSQVHEDGTA